MINEKNKDFFIKRIKKILIKIYGEKKLKKGKKNRIDIKDEVYKNSILLRFSYKRIYDIKRGLYALQKFGFDYDSIYNEKELEEHYCYEVYITYPEIQKLFYMKKLKGKELWRNKFNGKIYNKNKKRIKTKKKVK